MATRESEVNPFLQGNFAPWRLEGDAPDARGHRRDPARPERHLLPQRTESGLRAGGPLSLVRRRRHDPRHPRSRTGARPTATAGCRAPACAEERAAGRALYPGLLDLAPTEAPTFKNTANTNIVWHAGQAARAGRGRAADAARRRHARDRRRVRLRRQAHRADDRAPEDGSRDRRDAVLRLLAVPALPAVPRRRPAAARWCAPR